MESSQNKLWFIRKTYGWGWTPATWQGWLVTALYVVIMLGLAFTVDEKSSTREAMFMIVIPFVVLTSILLRITYKKGEKPRWQWGERKED